MTEPIPLYIVAITPPEPAIIPQALYPFECRGCGRTIGDVVEYSGRRWLMQRGVLHAHISCVCVWCGTIIQMEFGGKGKEE